MTRYLLDTTALIDFSKGREPVKSRVLQMVEAGDAVGICPVNIAELYAGVAFGEHQELDQFIAALTCWDINSEDGLRAGQYRWQFSREGKPLATADVLIAAVARRQRAVVVTNNVKDYPMADVQVLALGQPEL